VATSLQIGKIFTLAGFLVYVLRVYPTTSVLSRDLWGRGDISVFRFFKMAAVRRLGVVKVQNINCRYAICVSVLNFATTS